MPEALKVVIFYPFEELKPDFVMISHFVWNRQSAQVIEKCGLQYIKTVLHTTRYETKEDTMVYVITKEKFFSVAQK